MVDNMFLGKFFGETEQAAGILSNQLFTLLLVFEIGVAFAITPLVSYSKVNGNEMEQSQILKNSMATLFGVSVLLFAVLYFSTPLLYFLGQPPSVVQLAEPFFRVLAFSIIPISIFFVCKQYTEGLGHTTPSMYISIIGNLLNIILNYCLIKGIAFFPEMGYMGSSWATFYARCFMAFLFLFVLFNSSKLHPGNSFWKVKVNWSGMRRILFNGLGSGFQFIFEVAAFVICGLMCGVFGKRSIDAHGISLGIAAFTYMFANGISGAATIRVGNYYGQGMRNEIRMAGISAFKLVLICMVGFAVLLVSLHSVLPKAFTTSEEVASLSAELLLFAAFFQLFDGVQVTALGILRGMDDVRFPTYITFIGYWLIAIPLAWLLAFHFELKVYGVWAALSISLMFVSVSLYLRFRKLTRK
jgi:multidrug resistance protein, MATE family